MSLQRASITDSDNPERFFIWRICDQILAQANEPQRPRRQVRALPALLGERNQSAYPAIELFAKPPRRSWVVCRNVLPNVGYVPRREGVKREAVL
jgi:hypothetical protein